MALFFLLAGQVAKSIAHCGQYSILDDEVDNAVAGFELESAALAEHFDIVLKNESGESLGVEWASEMLEKFRSNHIVDDRRWGDEKKDSLTCEGQRVFI